MKRFLLLLGCHPALSALAQSDALASVQTRADTWQKVVLQEKTFERVGGVTPIHANVRIICATHRDLKALVARGEFREDLYYRLRGIVLEVPALRSRLGDLQAICAAILGRIASERGFGDSGSKSEATARVGARYGAAFGMGCGGARSSPAGMVVGESGSLKGTTSSNISRP